HRPHPRIGQAPPPPPERPRDPRPRAPPHRAPRPRLPPPAPPRRNPVRLGTARHRLDADGAAQLAGDRHAALAHADEPPARNLHLLLPRPPVHARSVPSCPLGTPTPTVGRTT